MGTSSRNLTEKTGVVVFARIITTVIDLAIVIATIQILSKTDFAIIGYLLMIHEVSRNLATLGFPESVFYFFEKISGSARRAFAIQTTLILCVTSLAAGLVILAISIYAPYLLSGWELSNAEQVSRLLPFMALLAVLEIPTWPVTNILLALDKQKQSAWYEMSTSLLTFGMLVIPLWLGFGLEIAIYSLTGYGFIRFIGSWIWMWLVLPPGKRTDAEVSLRKQIHFSVPLGFSSLVSKMNRYADKFIVSLMLPAAAYAEYTIGAQEVPVIRVIPFAVGSVLISRYVSLQIKEKKEELLELWYKGIEKVSLIVIPLTVLSIIAASDLIAIIAESDGTEYRNAVLPFQIYNLIILLRITHYGSILQAFGDTRGVFYLSVNLFTANIILTIPMTLWFGIVGTAAATFIANFYNWWITLNRIGTHMDLPATKVLPFPFYLKLLAVASLSALPVWIFRFVWIPAEVEWFGLLFTIVVYLGLFSAAGTISGVIRKNDWHKLNSWLRLRFLRS